MGNDKIKKVLLLNSFGMIAGFLIFIISVTNVKNYGVSLLLVALVGIIVMLSFGWRLDEFKRKKDLNTYKESLAYLKKHHIIKK